MLPGLGRLFSASRGSSCEIATAAYEVLHDPSRWSEPLELFVPAQVLFNGGKRDEALFWFYAAELRTRYQFIFKKGDRGQLLSVMMMSVGPPINNYGFSDTTNMRSTLDKVLAWDSAMPNTLRDIPHTPDQDAQIEKVYAGFRELQTKLIAEQATLEQQARQATQPMMASASFVADDRCRPGQLDPSLVDQEKRKESKQVEQLVRLMPDVTAAAGKIEAVSVMSSRTMRGSNMPDRYNVHVRGARETFVEVDVARTTDSPEFVVACISHVSPYARERNSPCPTAK